MSKIQKVILMCLSFWALLMWAGFIVKKMESNVEWASFVPSKEFQKWEAQGRLNLIDVLLDDKKLVTYRKNWTNSDVNLTDLAKYVANLQLNAYGVSSLAIPDVKIVPITGNANGFYGVEEKVIFLNALMKWNELPIERFFEVVLHENMHHILTYNINHIEKNNFLYQDFIGFHYSGVLSKSMHMHDVKYNPQEAVAYQSQRAGSYVGLLMSDLPVWAIASRTREINELSEIIVSSNEPF